MVGVITYDGSQRRYGLIVSSPCQGGPRTGPVEIGLNATDLRLLRMVAEGAGGKQIARTFQISISLAGRRVRQVVKKLGKHSRAEAVAHVAKAGLLEAE